MLMTSPCCLCIPLFVFFAVRVVEKGLWKLLEYQMEGELDQF
jgi:hypothetical protein